MTTLTITPTGTVNSAVSEHPNFVEARRALATFAGNAYRINTSSEGSGRTMGGWLIALCGPVVSTRPATPGSFERACDEQ